MIYSTVIVFFLSSSLFSTGGFAQAQPRFGNAFSIPSISGILNNIPQFATMQMPSMQMPQFRSMPSAPSFQGFQAPSQSFNNGPSFPSFPSSGGAAGFPSFLPSSPPSNPSPSSSSSSSSITSQNNNNGQPQLPPFSNQNNQQLPSFASLPTPDPRVMQNALSSIGSSLNSIQQNILPNRPNSGSSSPTNPSPSSSLPPYPYSSDSAKFDASLRQLIPGYDSMTPTQFQSTIASLSDKDMEAFQKQIGMDFSKFSKLSVFEAPFSPSSSCHQVDFGCQSYSSCFSCYQNRAQPKCGACLQLRSCSNDSLSCLLDGICKLCDTSNDNAPMCTALKKRCTTTASALPPHP